MTKRRLVCDMGAMVALLGSMISPVLATPLPRYGVFLYSSLCGERESGDAAGFRVKLVRSAKGDSLYLDWSEGGLFGPMLATKLTINPKTSKLSFTIPARTPPSDIPESESYAGEISNEAVVLDAKGYGGNPNMTRFRRPQIIPRVKAFDAEIVQCKEL